MRGSNEQFVTDPRFNKQVEPVDEEHIIKFFYRNTYVVDDILQFYNTKERSFPTWKN